MTGFRRLIVGVLAVLLIGGPALTQDGREEPKKTRSNAELLDALFGTDRAARTKAGYEASRALALTEDDWLRFMDTRFPTVDEEEEAKYYGAYALARIGTKRSYARLRKLLDERPKITRIDPDQGEVAVWGYQFEALNGWERLCAVLQRREGRQADRCVLRGPGELRRPPARRLP
jgi:hypothetical protein